MTSSNPTADLLLARRAAAGQADAWEELIEQHGRRIFNVALQFARRREDAEDLTQEIFLRLHRNLRQYTGEVPLIAWALRLSRNLCIDHYRRTKRERAVSHIPAAILEQMPGQSDVESESQHRQHMQAIYAALGELPEELSELVLLRDLQGWSTNETASYLDMPLGTIKSRLHRARRLLTERVLARLKPRRSGPEPQTGSALEAASC